MYKKKTTRLGADKAYKKPDVTFQEQLTKEQIAEKMDGYEKVDDVMDVPLGTHLRYFLFDNAGKASFRTGGTLTNKTNGMVYVVLSNGTHTWCVQVNNAKFYRKLTHTEEMDHLHDAYREKIDALESKLEAFGAPNLDFSSNSRAPKVIKVSAQKKEPEVEVELVGTVEKKKKRPPPRTTK